MVKLTRAQLNLLNSLLAQRDAAQHDSSFSDGWLLGSHGCHRSTAHALLRRGLVEFQDCKRTGGHIVCAKVTT